MPNEPTSPTALRNRFLDRLPEATRRKLLPLLQPVELAHEQVLYESNGPIDYAYFPAGVILSAQTAMQDGKVIEVATVGFEGLVGYDGFGGKTSPHRMVVQLGGGALRMGARDLQAASEED